MPSPIAPAAPVLPADLLPHGLCGAFSEELRIEMIVNVYPDGSSERAALALNPRRFFKLTRPLGAAAYATLFAFFQAHRGKPFYFYNLRETVPPFTYDASGGATTGRYIVVFDGGWSEEQILPRIRASFGLREVV
jgi:hypothetical protein